MFDSLGDRIKDYEACVEYKLTRRLPIIMRVDGVSFSRLTRKLERPYSPEFMQLMAETMLYLVSEIQGAVIGYQQSDEISVVIRNDQKLDSEPWYQNRLNKMISVGAAKATFGFNTAYQKLSSKLDLVGDAIFDCRVFPVPSITEAVNTLIWRQQDCTRNAISAAAQAELSEKFGRKTSLSMLHKKNSEEKKDLMLKCDLDFEDFYPSSFRRGLVASKIPTIIQLKNGSNVTRNKWNLNLDIPDFVDDKDYLYNIILNGTDVFRAASLPQ